MPAPFITTPVVSLSLREISAAQWEAKWLSRNGPAEHRANFALLATALKKYTLGRDNSVTLEERVMREIIERLEDIGKRMRLADPRTSLGLSLIRELLGLARAER
jgi:hypothetical protein